MIIHTMFIVGFGRHNVHHGDFWIAGACVDINAYHDGN